MDRLAEPKFCPRCATPLAVKTDAGKERPACPAQGCDFVHYGNPVPVVAGIVEHEGKVLLVRSRGWPEGLFGLMTGFLEAGESPEAAVVRELDEELSLKGEVASLVGVYAFEPMNQVIIAYHLKAQGEVKLGEELEAYRAIDPDRLRPWPFGTGLAVSAWLEARKRQ